MYLLLITTIAGFLSVHSSIITKLITRWLNNLPQHERKLVNERGTLLSEQSTLSITRDFVKHSKLQRKINAIDETLSESRSKRVTSNFFFSYAVSYGGKIVMSLLMLFLSVYYRKVPVFIVESKYDLFPFGGLISFPNEYANSVSVHFWMICCSSVAKLINKI